MDRALEVSAAREKAGLAQPPRFEPSDPALVETMSAYLTAQSAVLKLHRAMYAKHCEVGGP